MSLRTLYLRRLPSVNGRDAFVGRALYDRFRQLCEEAMLGHIVNDAPGVIDPHLKDDLVSLNVFQEFHPNIVFIEGGLFSDTAGNWKLPQQMAEEFCRLGGVLIVADANVNELNFKREHYIKSAKFFSALPHYGSLEHVVYGDDQQHNWRGSNQIICKPEKMNISDWLRPIYDDVPEILVGLPARLISWESLAATCNNDSTGTLVDDRWLDRIDYCPFASVAQIGGAGFAVFIAGSVTNDLWLSGCPHNTKWLTNLALFLQVTANDELLRRRSYRTSPHMLFLSHRSIDKPFVAAVSNAIKSEGVNLWLDRDKLIPSQSLTREISAALGKMTHFVLFWSSNCVNAPWVERELFAAINLVIENNIPLIIVRLDMTPVPAIVSDIYRIEASEEEPKAIGQLIVDAVRRLGRKMA